MTPAAHRWMALGLAAAVSMAVAALVHRWSPDPSAEVARGSEDAFARGLHRREIPPRGRPQRWTTERALFSFRDVPGPRTLEVRLHNQRTPIVVAADGVVVGSMAVGATAARFDLADVGRSVRTVELRTDGFAAGRERPLGALLDAVALHGPRSSWPRASLLVEFVLPAVAVAGAAGVAGWPVAAAVLMALLINLAEAFLLWPAGIVRSSYALVLSALLVLGALLALAFARWRSGMEARRWAFAALLAAFLVQGVLATSPLMVVSDAVMHANNLAKVARGDWFLTSVTQHARPFQIPYGVSFYALLVPLLKAGLDAVWLVRAGAAAAAVSASAALFTLLARRDPRSAAVAVILLQAMPITFDLFSHGNFSNVFGQACTTGFFVWWAVAAPRRWLLGALFFALAGLSHLSSLIVLLVLAAALLVARRRQPRLDGRRPQIRTEGQLRAERGRLAAVAVGLLVVLAYYAHFTSLVLGQLPRLLEGGGQGREAAGTATVLGTQLLRAVLGWGIPATVLAIAGLAMAARHGAAAPGASPDTPGGLRADDRAYLVAGGILAVVAIVSPIEVRYVYSLTVPVALTAAVGAAQLAAWGRWGSALAAALLAVQGALGIANIADAILVRYR